MTVTVVGQGTCTKSYVQDKGEIPYPSTSVVKSESWLYNLYTITATPAAGWVFDHFEVDEKINFQEKTTGAWKTVTTTHNIYTSRNNPLIGYRDDDRIAHFPWEGHHDFNYQVDTESYRYVSASEQITCVFVQRKPHGKGIICNDGGTILCDTGGTILCYQ